MNKYSDKSDPDINLEIAKYVLCAGSEIYSAGEFPDDIKFDPCNNPADAMPIIIENKINLKHLANNTNNLVLANHKEYWCIRKNPYRAGCEVYLLMKDAENETSSSNVDAGIN